MRSSRILVLCALSAAVLAGCGGGAEQGAAPGADSQASVDLKSRLGGDSGGSGKSSSSGATAPAGSGATAVPAGRLLASNCFNCHGTDGHPNGGFDSLAGDSAAEIVKTLKEMAAKSAEDGGIMRAHAMGYTDEQMWQLGGYFASLR